MKIGKAPDNDLVLADDTVSRHHCELVRDERRRPRPRPRLDQRHEGRRHARARGRRQPGTVLKVGEVEISLRPSAAADRGPPERQTDFGGAIGQSLAMRTIFGVLERIAPTDATVLLEGETGTGKDVLARAISTESPRAQGAVRRRRLRRRELLAHRERALRPRARRVHRRGRRAAGRVRAGRRRDGVPRRDRRAAARRPAQAAARARDARSFAASAATRRSRATCASSPRPTATSRARCSAGKFREDLYFRLAVVPGHRSAALRARRDDIPALVRAHPATRARRRRAAAPARRRDARGAHGARLAGQRARAAQRPRARRSTWRRRRGAPSSASSSSRRGGPGRRRGVPLRAGQDLPGDAARSTTPSSSVGTSSGCSAATAET